MEPMKLFSVFLFLGFCIERLVYGFEYLNEDDWVFVESGEASRNPLFVNLTLIESAAEKGADEEADWWSVDVAGGRTMRDLFGGILSLQGAAKNLPGYCTAHMDATLCFFPENLVANIQTPLFILNAAYDVWQLQASLASSRSDPHGFWRQCKLNYANCNASQINFLQGFRNEMISALKGFSISTQNGLFINSCFAHCQSERQDTWFGSDSPAIANKGIAKSVGDWYFDRSEVKTIDCPYPCDKTCHNLVSRQVH